MLALIRAFTDIALHRRGPQDLPASWFLLGLVVAAYSAVTALALRSPLMAVEHPAGLLVADPLLTLAFLWAVLKAFARESRFLQTAAAVFGTMTLFSVLGMPLLYWAERPNVDVTVPVILALVFTAWGIDVRSFVLARAIERPYVLAVAIVLGYELLTYSLRITFFPPLNFPPAS